MALSGLALPAIRGSGGYFSTKRDIDVAWGDLLIAILTPIGSRFMRRSFGSGVAKLLFDPADSLITAMVDQYIREAASRHCPYISIRKIDVKTNIRQLDVKVSFSLAGVNADKSMTLDRKNTVNYLSLRRSG